MYSTFKSHLLGIGSGSPENKVELGSERLSMILTRGGVGVELGEGDESRTVRRTDG